MRTVECTTMPFYPDIVVTEPGSSHALLVVEAKVGKTTAASESQLRHYMWEMSCPVGLLVSPREIFLYRNLFTGYSDDSVERVGTFPAPSSWREFSGRDSEVEFERRVQKWLERLTSERPTDLSREAADALQQLVIPGLLHGDIHASGPRVSR
jgi:hypothetical protein